MSDRSPASLMLIALFAAAAALAGGCQHSELSWETLADGEETALGEDAPAEARPDTRPTSGPATRSDTRPVEVPAAKPCPPCVGVVDIEQVMADLGWDRDRKSRLDFLNNELGIQRRAFVEQLSGIIKQRRAALFTEAKFTAADITRLDEGRDLDKLPWTPQQRDQYVTFSQQMSQVLKGSEARHGQLLQQWLGEANRAYVALMGPGIRRAAQASGVTVVLPSTQTLYTADSANLSGRVVDELKNVRPADLPRFPKFDMQVQMNDAEKAPGR